jgi:hypothetical protein
MWDDIDDEDYGDFSSLLKPLPQSTSNSNYECTAQNLTTYFENRSVTKINGDHVNTMSNNDVKILTVHLQNTPFLPLNIGEHFKNLSFLNVIKSNVQHLMSGDLSGLEKLELLNLKNNPIKQIGHNFFQGMSSLKILILAECHLKMIDAEAFDPLINLREVNLRDNDCINEFYSIAFNDEFTYKMKILIKNNCQGVYISYNFEEKCIEANKQELKEDSTSISSVLLIFSIVVLSLFTAIFVYALVKIRKELQKDSWNEVHMNSENL